MELRQRTYGSRSNLDILKSFRDGTHTHRFNQHSGVRSQVQHAKRTELFWPQEQADSTDLTNFNSSIRRASSLQTLIEVHAQELSNKKVP